MAEKFSSLRKLGRWLFGKPPKVPPSALTAAGSSGDDDEVLPSIPTARAGVQDAPYGHRGVAIGSNKPGQQDLSAENRAKWRELSKEAAEDFMNGEILFVHSTNVVAAQYFPDAEKMMIEYKGGAAYMYSNISKREAWIFLQAESKGSFTWTYLRVRGKGNSKKFKKPFVKLR